METSEVWGRVFVEKPTFFKCLFHDLGGVIVTGSNLHKKIAGRSFHIQTANVDSQSLNLPREVVFVAMFSFALEALMY